MFGREGIEKEKEGKKEKKKKERERERNERRKEWEKNSSKKKRKKKEKKELSAKIYWISLPFTSHQSTKLFSKFYDIFKIN